MSPPAMKVGVIARTDKPQAGPLVAELLQALADRGVEALCEEATARLAGATGGMATGVLAETADLLVVLGGDGTLLRVVHGLHGHIKPVFGINLGSLGFLTCVSSEDWREAVRCIADGDYVLSDRSRLEVRAEREGRELVHFTALNDAVVSRGRLSQLIKLEVCVDGRVLTVYNADGLIVATPTGSTAYSLSAGGPILLPDSGSLVITPICPHVLTNRSTVVSDRAVLTVRLLGEATGVTLNVDGEETVELQSGDLLTMERAAVSLPLVMMPHTTFSGVLRQKLKWSGSAI